VEQVKKAFRRAGKLGNKLFEATLNGLVSGSFRAVGPKGIQLMIKNNWHTIPMILYALTNNSPKYPKELSEKEIAKLENMRRNLARMVLPVLGMARRIAANFPPELVEQKITGEWLMQKLEEKHPQIAKIVKEQENWQKWINEEAVIIRLYLIGRWPKIGKGKG